MTDPAALFRALETTLAERFGGTADYRSLAPGRVNLIGDHTDYSQGFCLPMAVDRYTAAVATKRNDAKPLIRVYSLAAGEAQLPCNEAPPKLGDWRDYLGGVIAGYQDLGFEIPGINIVLGANLPMGAGLSSSASLELCLATLIEACCDRHLDVEERALLCQRAEHRYPGVPCGILDQFAVSFAQAGKAMLLDCRERHIDEVALPENLSIVIVDSKVSHALSDGGYATRRREVQEAEETLGKSLRDCTLDDLEKLRDPILCKRARHVITENQRVLRVRDCLRDARKDELSELIFESHASLAQDFEVSCPELDRLVEIAGDAGALGARMTGGGFGGSMVCFFQGDIVARDSFTQQLRDVYHHDTGITADILWTKPSKGAEACLAG